jgi:serine protease Do
MKITDKKINKGGCLIEENTHINGSFSLCPSKRTMNVYLFILLLVGSFAAKAQLNPKLIAEKYNKAVVKIIMYDPILEQNTDYDGVLSRGSGFIVSEDGIVFTNKHVVSEGIYGYLIADAIDNNQKSYEKLFLDINNANQYAEAGLVFTNFYHLGVGVPLVQIFHGNGPEDYSLYLAQILSYSDVYDGAMLKIVADLKGNSTDEEKFASTIIGNSDEASQGDKICVLGFPAQYSGNTSEMLLDRSTLTMGYHSGWDYVFDKNYGMIKTDAKINSGNSGGPAFGEDNKVIGIASAVGVKTDIGLLSGINGMFYVTAPYSEHFKNLMMNGLTSPSRANVISSSKYQVPELPTAEDLNKIIKEKIEQMMVPKTVQVIINLTSADTGKPITNATGSILVMDESTASLQSISRASADSQGRLPFSPEVEAGKKYVLTVNADNYQAFRQMILIDKDHYSFNLKMARNR